MKLNVRVLHKDYVFIETTIQLKNDEENVFFIEKEVRSRENKYVATYLYLVKKSWWKENKQIVMYKNRIKIS